LPQASVELHGVSRNAVSYPASVPPNAPPGAKFFNHRNFTFTLEKAR